MDVNAPWPGTVQEVQVSVGDTVEVAQGLMVLESMKMLHPVPSPGAGAVTAVHVSVGDYVEAGARLVTIDS